MFQNFYQEPKYDVDVHRFIDIRVSGKGLLFKSGARYNISSDSMSLKVFLKESDTKLTNDEKNDLLEKIKEWNPLKENSFLACYIKGGRSLDVVIDSFLFLAANLDNLLLNATVESKKVVQLLKRYKTKMQRALELTPKYSCIDVASSTRKDLIIVMNVIA